MCLRRKQIHSYRSTKFGVHLSSIDLPFIYHHLMSTLLVMLTNSTHLLSAYYVPGYLLTSHLTSNRNWSAWCLGCTWESPLPDFLHPPSMNKMSMWNDHVVFRALTPVPRVGSDFFQAGSESHPFCSVGSGLSQSVQGLGPVKEIGSGMGI